MGSNSHWNDAGVNLGWCQMLLAHEDRVAFLSEISLNFTPSISEGPPLATTGIPSWKSVRSGFHQRRDCQLSLVRIPGLLLGPYRLSTC